VRGAYPQSALREGTRCYIKKMIIVVAAALAAFVAVQPLGAQSLATTDANPGSEVLVASKDTVVSPPVVPPAGFIATLAPPSPTFYTPPTEEQKFHAFVWNAVGPVAFAGAAFAGAIDQGFDFQKRWGQGWNAYGVRVASDLGISMVTATSQYAIAEADHEDAAYYRCTCAGFGRRFVHAAISSVTSRRGDDGHRSFSLALTASPFVGPMVAANTWLPTHNGVHLGFIMGEHNLLGQFAQNEALEFVYGGPNTVLGRLQRRFSKSSPSDSQ